MKRIFFLSVIASLILISFAPVSRAQDAATEERLNKINGLVQDLLDAQARQQKQIAELESQIRALREEQSKPNTSNASQDDLRRLAESVQEIDRKREADKELILKKISELGKVVAAPSTPRRPIVDDSSAPLPDKGYEYVVQSGDTISLIVQAYREKGIKVTTDSILKGNPGLNPAKLKVGQKIFIPAPAK